MSYEPIAAALADGDVVILDGGTGTELELRGAKMDPEAWCGPATLQNLDLLEEIHRQYIEVGAQVITANTYASSRLMLNPAGFGHRFEEINKAAVDTALKAREASGHSNIAVAGSLSHMVPMKPGEEQVDRSRNPSPAEIADAFGELAQLQKDEGCDLIILEMMFHPERVGPALEAATQTGLPVWAGLAARQGGEGAIFSFTTESDVPLEEIMSVVNNYDVAAAGVMHTPSNVTAPAIDIVKQHHEGPLMAYPDSGYFTMPEWQFENIIEPSDLSQFAEGWKAQGVQILGGCCGLSPKHIQALANL